MYYVRSTFSVQGGTTVWWVIFGGAKFCESQNQLSELIFVILVFTTATRTNEWCCAAVLNVHASSDRFQIGVRSEELTSCCSNSIDAGYSSLLRCEGEIQFIRTSPFLLASGDKLKFTSSARTLGAVVGNTGPLLGLGVEDAISSLVCPTLTDEVGHTRLCHQLVDTSDKATSEPFVVRSQMNLGWVRAG